jgi:hypothetical protein
MAATLQQRMVEVQPDLVVMAIIPEDFTWPARLYKAGYLVDHKVSFLPDSPVRKALQRIHLLFILRAVALSWIFAPHNVAPLLSRGELSQSYRSIQQFKETADRHGLEYLMVLLPRMQANAWGPLPNRLTQDAIHYLDLSPLGIEFTLEEYMANRFAPHASPAVHRRIGESLAEYAQHQQGFL